MTGVLSVVAPVFALIAAGYVLARLGLVHDLLEKWVTRLVFGLAIPTLLFRTMVAAQAPEASPWALWGAYFGGVAAAWIITYTVVREFAGKDRVDASMAALSGGYSNTVLVGIPLIFSFFGEAQSAVALFIILSVNLPVMMVLGTVTIEWNRRGAEGGFWHLVWLMCKRIAVNPVLVGLASGLLYRQTGWGIAGPAQFVIDWIAWIAAPAALLTMGVSLNRFGVTGGMDAASVIVPVKLIVHPLFVAVLALWVFELPEVWVAVAVLFAASPTGINAFLLASRYDVAVAPVSTSITWSTALSVVTITLIAWGFGFSPA